MPAIEQKGQDVLLHVRVQPKASRDAIAIETDGRIRVALTAPPVDGEANKALCSFAAKRLGIPRRRISLISGEKSREKTLLISGAHLENIEAILRA